MIVEITTNKYSKAKIEKPKIDIYRDWFNSNKDVWTPGWKIEALLKTHSIRKYVNKLRCEGMSIISSRKGYKLTSDKDEIRKCYAELRLRALRALTAAKEMKKLL